MFNLFSKKQAEPEKLFFKTDIHCHVVPGIDDGSKSVESSIELVKRMKGWGLERIVTTPHVTQDTFENTPEIIENAYGEFRQGLDSAGIEMETDHSAEYRLDGFFQNELEAGHIRKLHGDYLLVENSYIQEPLNLLQVLFDLKLRGFQPILAHPERYGYYYDNKKRYKEIHDTGTLFQLNILSLAGYYGKQTRKIAEMLIDKGMVEFIGTDLHHTRHADSIEAYLATKDYRQVREKLAGKILNDKIFEK